MPIFLSIFLLLLRTAPSVYTYRTNTYTTYRTNTERAAPRVESKWLPIDVLDASRKCLVLHSASSEMEFSRKEDIFVADLYLQRLSRSPSLSLLIFFLSFLVATNRYREETWANVKNVKWLRNTNFAQIHHFLWSHGSEQGKWRLFCSFLFFCYALLHTLTNEPFFILVYRETQIFNDSPESKKDYDCLMRYF